MPEKERLVLSLELIRSILNSDVAVNIYYGLANILGMLIVLLIMNIIMHFVMVYGSTLIDGFEYVPYDDWTGESGYLKVDGVRVTHSKLEIYFWVCFLKGLLRLITFQIPIAAAILGIAYLVGTNFRFFS